MNNSEFFKHNNTLSDNEPAWGSVDKTSLPALAFAYTPDKTKKSTWKLPHHFVPDGGEKDENGIYTSGTMYLHRGGVNSAWGAIRGARAKAQVPPSAISHIKAHRNKLANSSDTKASGNSLSYKDTIIDADGLKLNIMPGQLPGYDLDDCSYSLFQPKVFIQKEGKDLLRVKVELAREGTTLDDRMILFDMETLQELKEKVDPWVYLNHDWWAMFFGSRKVEDRVGELLETRIENQDHYGENVAVLVSEMMVYNSYEKAKGTTQAIKNGEYLGSSLAMVNAADEPELLHDAVFLKPRQILYANLDIVTEGAFNTVVTNKQFAMGKDFNNINFKEIFSLKNIDGIKEYFSGHHISQEDISMKIDIQYMKEKEPEVFKQIFDLGKEEIGKQIETLSLTLIEKDQEILKMKTEFETKAKTMEEEKGSLLNKVDRVEKILLQKQIAEFQRTAFDISVKSITSREVKVDTDFGKKLLSRMPNFTNFIKDDQFDIEGYSKACDEVSSILDDAQKFYQTSVVTVPPAITSNAKDIVENPPQPKDFSTMSLEEKKRNVMDRAVEYGINKIMPTMTSQVMETAKPN